MNDIPAGTAAKEFADSGFFVLRTPLLPFEDFLALSEGLAFSQALQQDSDLSSTLAADRELVRTHLKAMVHRPEVHEALWLASPDLLSSLSTWKQEPESPKAQKIERALYRYIARMTSRPTPFGLFAGCSLGSIGATTRLEIGPRSSYRRRSRLDLEYLCNLAEKISSDPVLQQQLRFRPNTSLYMAAGRYHHAQGYLSNNARCYRLIATEPTTYLAATLQRASISATPVDLASALVNDDPEIKIEEAQNYIRQLIDSQILVAELIPPITGPDPIEDMLPQLENIEEKSFFTILKTVTGNLQRLDAQGLGNDVAGYEEIAAAIRQLPSEFKLDHLVQVDMVQKAEMVTLDQRLVREILRGVDLLHSLAIPSRSDPFQQFKADFLERYHDQEIPLVLALDEEVGIGFERKATPESTPEPLLEQLDFSVSEEGTRTAGSPEFVLLRKLQQLTERKTNGLELDKDLLQALRAKNPQPLPDAFAAMVQIIGPANTPDECSIYIHSVSGPSGASLLGRFCPADGALTTSVKEHLRQEERVRAGENVIYAEIAHLPEGRIGNVICRPMLRDYEIPFIAASRAALDRQIPTTDLMLSLRNDRIVLRSQRLGCEVVPRLSTAHSYTHGRNLKLYKFLCLLQTQGVSAGLSWNWGLLEEAEFLPRVTMGKIILSPATWRVVKETIDELVRHSGPKRLQEIDRWRTSKGIPRFVLLAESDNQLLVDFENILSVETMIEYIRNRQAARFVEMLFRPEDLYAKGPEGHFTHELVVPFVRKVPPAAPNEASKTTVGHRPQSSVPVARPSVRNFLPGSQWLFAKIYASPSQLDRLLLEQVKPLVTASFASGAADGWFFIRYGDPHWHLRLRFHGDPQRLSAEVLPALRDCLETREQEGKLWRVQLDTYEREIERYGGPDGMEISERLFQYDSELVLELLAAISYQLGTKIRWQLAFTAVDRMLAALGLDLDARRRLVNNLGKIQEKNFAVGDVYKKQLSEKFRAERQTIDSLLVHNLDPIILPAGCRPALKLFDQQMNGLGNKLKAIWEEGRLSRAIEDLAGSYVHMHLNRIFRFAANAQEMVLYDFLARGYDSKMAKEKRSPKQAATGN